MLTSLIRILVVDDHQLIRDGLVAVIGAEPDMRVVAEAGNGEEAVAMFRAHRPTVTLMDLRLPVMDGTAAIRVIRRESPHAPIIALTSYAGDEDIHRALEAGAQGYLLKDMLRNEVIRAIRTVHRGSRIIPPAVAAKLAEYIPRQELSARELEVLRGMAGGLRNKEIAHDLGMAEGTVKTHVKNILEKLNASDRTHAVMLALQRGILQLPKS